MRDTYEGPTAQAEGAVFPSVMAAFFAALALGSLAAAFLAVRGSRPRMATVATVALWCLVAVLMFLGAGAHAPLRCGMGSVVIPTNPMCCMVSVVTICGSNRMWFVR